jgi:hypothetical protein
VAGRLRALTKRRIVIRQHPGNFARRPARGGPRERLGVRDLVELVRRARAGRRRAGDLRGAVVDLQDAALSGATKPSSLTMFDRAEAWAATAAHALERLAWAQWTVEEIASR